jgi:hypothetical protein
MPPKEKKSKKSPYQFFGAPKYDPRKENRIHLKPTSSKEEDVGIIEAFVETALLGGATVVEVRCPASSSKAGHYELYCDTGVDSKAFKAMVNRRRKDCERAK